MADTKTTALDAFTPILTDIVYGVDDPGGTPTSGKFALSSLLTLFQNNLSFYDTGVISSIVNGEGAALVGIEDTGSEFTGTDVQAALLELYNWHNTIASTANGAGASLVGVEDTGAKFATDNVNASLVEIMSDLDVAEADIDAIEADYLTSSDIGTSVQAFDGDTLKADTTDVLTAAFEGAIDNDGTEDTGTYTPSIAAGSNYKRVTFGGDVLVDPPSPSANDVAISVNLLMVNDTGGNDTISFTNFSDVDGDSISATAGDIHLGFITVYDVGGTEYSSITIKQLVAN